MILWALVSGVAGALMRLWPAGAWVWFFVPGAIALGFLLLSGDWIWAVAAYLAWGIGLGVGALIVKVVRPHKGE